MILDLIIKQVVDEKDNKMSTPNIFYRPNKTIEKVEYRNENNQLHRTDGPAVVCYYENGQVQRESYYLDDKLHRTDGPSDVWYFKNGQVSSEHYHFNGQKLSKSDWELKTKAPVSNPEAKTEIKILINGKEVVVSEANLKNILSALGS